MASVPLIDELLLLAYDRSGTLQVRSEAIDYALAGAVLMELLLAGRLAVPERHVAVVDPAPTGDPLCDHVLSRIRAERPRKPSAWLEPLSKGLRDQLLHRLGQAGWLRRDEHRVLGLFPRLRFPWATGAEPPARADARQRLRAAVDATGQVDPRTGALAALVAAVGGERQAVPDRKASEVRRRLRAVAASSWPAEAVRKAIGELEAAVTAAVTAATTAATTAAVNS